MFKSLRRLFQEEFLSIVSLVLVLWCAIFPIKASANDGALDEIEGLGEKFDHIATGYELTGEHAYVVCIKCHTDGLLETLPRQCEACHDNKIAVGRSSTHVNTSDPCDACHTTENFLSSAVMDHSITTASCVSCHGGVTAEGKSDHHLASTDICEGCHTTNYWLPVSNVDHDQVVGACISCHRPGGVAKTNKGTDHMHSSDICEACHTAIGITWTPIDTVDHGYVLDACSYCHDGVIARGKGPMHVVTIQECNSCHVAGGVAGPDPWAATD